MKAFDPRDRSPLLTKLKWDVLMEGLSSELVMGLVNVPQKGEILSYNSDLKPLVQGYFTSANKLIEQYGNSLLVQRVMYRGVEDREGSGVSDKRLRALKDKTVDNYSMWFFKLILCLFRYLNMPEGEERESLGIIITPEQQHLLQQLQQLLTRPHSSARTDQGHILIQQIGYSLLSHPNCSITTPPWDYTIYKFFVYCSVREGGVFEDAVYLSPRAVRLHWLFRALVVKKVIHDVGNEVGEPEEQAR